ncbi:MAG: LytTR family DNA-binding domain-containing protein [Marinoscillum sp.]
MKLRTLIIEDHRDSRELLKYLCEAIAEVEVVGLTGEVMEAKSLIESRNPDLIFLDIELKNGNGFEVLKSVNRNLLPFDLIFTTGDPNHAISAIHHNADDYLVKPINSANLRAAIARVSSKKYLLTKGKRNIRFGDNIYVRSRGNNLEYYLSNKQEPIIERGSLSGLLSTLPSNVFLQVHRSFIINREHIKELNSSSVLMTKMHRIPVGEKHQSVLGQIS